MANLFEPNFSPRPGRGPLVLIGLGLVILLVGLSWLVIGRGAISLPVNLAGLPLVEQVSGRPALMEIQRLHGQDFPLVDGTVARYGDGAATVWVSSASTTLLAGRQVEAMTERIAERNSPFSPQGQTEVEGLTIYMLTGMGQVHYYFQLDQQVIWLAITTDQAEQSLVELIRYLQL